MAPTIGGCHWLRCHLLSSPADSRVFPCHARAPGLPALTLESEANPLVAQTYAGKLMPLVSRLCITPPQPSAISLWRVHRTGWHWLERKHTKTLVDVKTLISKGQWPRGALELLIHLGLLLFPHFRIQWTTQGLSLGDPQCPNPSDAQHCKSQALKGPLAFFCVPQ